jgi:hypothetical protein
VRMAARRLSDGAIRCTFIAILLQGDTLPHWQRSMYWYNPNPPTLAPEQ